MRAFLSLRKAAAQMCDLTQVPRLLSADVPAKTKQSTLAALRTLIARHGSNKPSQIVMIIPNVIEQVPTKSSHIHPLLPLSDPAAAKTPTHCRKHTL